MRKIVFNKPLCDNVTLKHPRIRVFCPRRDTKALLKHLQPRHSSDDGSDSAVGENVGFFKTLGLRPRYFQAETYHHSCEPKVMDGEDVRDGACSASWQLHLDKSLQNAKKQEKLHGLVSSHLLKQNQHIKGYWSTFKNNFIVPRYYIHVAQEKAILVLDNGFVT